MNYKILNGIDNSTYALIFNSGDEVMEILKTFANEHSLKLHVLRLLGHSAAQN